MIETVFEIESSPAYLRKIANEWEKAEADPNYQRGKAIRFKFTEDFELVYKPFKLKHSIRVKDHEHSTPQEVTPETMH